MLRFRCCRRRYWLVALVGLHEELACRKDTMVVCASRWGPLGLVGRSYRIAVETEPQNVLEGAQAAEPY